MSIKWKFQVDKNYNVSTDTRRVIRIQGIAESGCIHDFHHNGKYGLDPGSGLCNNEWRHIAEPGKSRLHHVPIVNRRVDEMKLSRVVDKLTLNHAPIDIGKIDEQMSATESSFGGFGSFTFQQNKVTVTQHGSRRTRRCINAFHSGLGRQEIFGLFTYELNTGSATQFSSVKHVKD